MVRSGDPVHLRRLAGTPEDVAAIQRLLETSPDYSLRSCGRLPEPDDGRALFDALPPGRTREDKFVFGIYAGETMVGVLDIARGYPEASIAFIGLLLIAGGAHGMGYGRDAMTGLERVVATWPECRRLRLAVLRSNIEVLHFWERMGFLPTGEVKPHSDASFRTEAILMERRLPRTYGSGSQ